MTILVPISEGQESFWFGNAIITGCYARNTGKTLEILEKILEKHYFAL